MNEDRETFFYNPYLPDNREDKGERMSIIRATLIICATVLISVVAVIFFNNQNERFSVTAHKGGIFIFDHKTSATNYCTTSQCKMISSEFVLPKFTTIVETIPTNAQQISPQAVQSQLVNPNFGMVNSNQPQQPMMQGQQPMMQAGNNLGVPNQFSADVANQKKKPSPAGNMGEEEGDNDGSDGSDQGGEESDSEEGEEE